MNICIVINSVIPVSGYGGTQRVMWSLGKALTVMGHQVSFLVRKGSACPFAQVYPIDTQKEIGKQIPSQTDIIHFNDRVPEPASSLPKPWVVTYHGNKLCGEPDRNAIFVSRNHAQRFGSDSFVYNGLDWDDYGAFYKGAVRSDFHFLAKAAWRIKNVRGAIDLIKALPTNDKLIVLGGYRFNFKMGFRFTFTPRVRFKGMVGGEEKQKYLQHSKGLIFPVLWDEPFGLAVIESLYYGAPVFATPYGSLPELVTPEVGFLTNKQSDMIAHMLNPHFSPERCHQYAADVFNAQVMATAYLKKYEIVLSGGKLNATFPRKTAPTFIHSFRK